MHVGIVFSNLLGNFILMTSALKVLRNREGISKIDLLTTTGCLKNNPSVKHLAEKLFDGIRTKDYMDGGYTNIYCADWSAFNYKDEVRFNPKSIWWKTGVHEIQMYMNAIDAKPEEFCGFEMPINLDIKVECKRPHIAFANASRTRGSRRGDKVGWDKFPELSRVLSELGYSVVLTGYKDELLECEGIHYGDNLEIDQIAGIISQCDLMICTDTGLMHVADALGIPIIFLAGSTPVVKSHPVVSKYKVVRKFISCAPCFQSFFWNSCKDSMCMKLISVKDVLNEVFKFKLNSTDIKRKPSVRVKMNTDRSIFRFLKCEEIVYDPSYDMIGDVLGSAFLLKYLKSKNPNLKVSWLKGRPHLRGFAPWYDTFDVSRWTGLKLDAQYSSLINVNGGVVITSRRDFCVWDDLNLIPTPKMHRPERLKGMPESYISLHILQPTKEGERSTSYVKRRALDFDKYSKLCEMLKNDGHKIVRVGASYDSIKKIDGIIDLSMDDLSLEDTLKIISWSQMFIGGDTGLKLAASSMGVPCTIEIDDHSKAIGALSGCDTSIVRDFKLGTPVEELYNSVIERIGN